MRYSNARGILLLMVFGAWVLVGCGDDSTGPGDKKEPPSEELTHSWSVRFGDADEQSGNDVAIDPSGNAVIAGSFWGTVDFGGGALTSAGTNDIFVAKFNPDGTHLWSKGFGDATLQEVAYVTVDASGNVIIAGIFEGTVNFGGGTLTSAGSWDAFVAAFDPTGAHLWSKRFGDASEQGISGVTVGSTGAVFITGAMDGTVDFGGGALTSAGSTDIFVVKFEP